MNRDVDERAEELGSQAEVIKLLAGAVRSASETVHYHMMTVSVFALLLSVIWSLFIYNSAAAQVRDLRATVDRQRDAIAELQRKNGEILAWNVTTRDLIKDHKTEDHRND